MDIFICCFVIVISLCILIFLYLIIMLLSMGGNLGKMMQCTLGHNYKYCSYSDQKIKTTLDGLKDGTVVVVNIDCYNILFSDGVDIWIANKYYGYGSIRGEEGRPSYKQMKRIMKLEESL